MKNKKKITRNLLLYKGIDIAQNITHLQQEMNKFIITCMTSNPKEIIKAGKEIIYYNKKIETATQNYIDNIENIEIEEK